MKKLLTTTALTLGALTTVAHGQMQPTTPGTFPTSAASGTIQYSVAVCDPNSPFRCVAPDASGNMPVTLSGSPIVLTYGKATTAAPTYTNNTNNPFSLDLAGNLRTSLLTALPAGSNTIGAVTQASGPWTSNVTQFGSSAVVTGTGAGGAGIPRVTVSNDSTVGLVAGTAAVGYVGGFDTVVTNAPTVTNAAYTANAAIGGLQTVSAFRNTTQPSGLLSWVQISSKGGYNTSITIYGFTAARNGGVLYSTCTDKSAFVLNSSDLPYLIPGFPITITPVALNATTQTIGSQSLLPSVSVKNADSVASQNLYFCAVANSTTTPASTSDLTFYYSLIQD